MMTTRPLLLGHRGARAEKSIPENTIASFDRALADGCDGFELDVRLTADRKAMICHDPRSEGVEIARASADQLPKLAELRDVLKRYRESAFLDIELKVAGLEEMTAFLVAEYPASRGLVISSFLPEVLEVLHRKNEKIPLGLICETHTDLREWKSAPIESLIPHHSLVDEKLVQDVHREGKKIFVWTVNSAVQMKRFAAWEVDGIISDETKLLRATLR
jgi:glycerophosphoryl diester phosphodiesterase